MKLDLINNLEKSISNKFVQDFIKELQKYIETNIKKEASSLNETEIKLTTKFRDKFYLERSNILNAYANKTSDKGQMYYIYSKNTKLDDTYNLCICEEGKENNVIEVNKSELPEGAIIGSVLRKKEGVYLLDNDATSQIKIEILNLENKILEEQKEFLTSTRIEGHIYELSEKDTDRVWLFDITNNTCEAIEEIEFPIELLQNAIESDLFIYENGTYKKYIQ